jgi:hypothetical protein
MPRPHIKNVQAQYVPWTLVKALIMFACLWDLVRRPQDAIYFCSSRQISFGVRFHSSDPKQVVIAFHCCSDIVLVAKNASLANFSARWISRSPCSLEQRGQIPLRSLSIDRGVCVWETRIGLMQNSFIRNLLLETSKVMFPDNGQ